MTGKEIKKKNDNITLRPHVHRMAGVSLRRPPRESPPTRLGEFPLWTSVPWTYWELRRPFVLSIVQLNGRNDPERLN